VASIDAKIMQDMIIKTYIITNLLILRISKKKVLTMIT